MATISTSQDLDSAARSAGETMTINSGATLTINTHTRYHKNAPAAGTGSLSSFTMTAATGGRCLVDGRNVRILAYTGGSGNVPTLGSTITQSTVSGELLCVTSAINVAPTAAGSAMPATGFIMFKSVTGGPFAAGALAGITATASGADVVGFLEVVMDDAANITIGRAQKYEIKGAWYELGTTNGSRGQQIQCPNFGGSNYFVPAVWIETGNGTNVYEAFPAFYNVTGTAWTTTALGTDERSKAVEAIGGGIIRIGSNGTNNIGYLPPSGCKVRIPNIMLKSCATGTRASDSLPNGTLATRPEFTTTNAGQVDVELAVGDWYFNLNQPYSVRLEYVGYLDQMVVTECATALDLDNVICGRYYATQDSNAFTLTSNFAGGTVVDCKFGRAGTIAANDYGSSITYCKGITFTRTYFVNWTFRTNAGGRPVYLAYCSDLTFNDCVIVGNGMYFVTCLRTIINDLQYADNFHSTSSTSNPPVGVIQLTTYTVDTIVDGFTWFTTVANQHPDLAIVYLSGAIGVKIRNIGTKASPMSAGSSNPMAYFVDDAGNNLNVEAKRVYFDLISSTFYRGINSSKGILLQNCQGNITSAKTLICAGLNLEVRNSEFTNYAPASTASIYGSNFYNAYTSSTAGRLGIIFNEPTAENSAYITTNFTTSAVGTSGFNSTTGLALINSGDYAIFEFPWTIIGIDSFQNSAPTITTATNMTVEYQIDTGSGWNGTWKTFDASNLSGETVDEVAGFRFKIKVTANATAAANLLTVCYCLTYANAAAQGQLYPLDLVTLQLTNLRNPSEVRVFSAGTTTPIAGEENVTSGTFSCQLDAATYPNVDIAVLSLGYQNMRYLSQALGTGLTIPVVQQIDRQYANPT